MVAMTSTERVRRFRERQRGILAGGPCLFPELAPAPAPGGIESIAAVGRSAPKRTEAERKASRESSRRHRAKKRAAALAPIGDPDRPDVPGLVAWISRLTVSQGRKAGEAFEVLPWQAEFLERALLPGQYDAALSMARGNGKSTFLAAVICAALAGPLRQPRGEVLLVASSFGQARIVFEHVTAFMAPFFEARALDWRIEDSTQRAVVTHKPSGARVRCIGSDPKRAHGLAYSIAVLDEPAQWPPNTAERMVAAIETASGKIPGSRRWMIGTRPDTSQHFFEKALKGAADVAMVFAGDVPEDDDDDVDPHDPAQWMLANPSLPNMPDLRRAIENESEKARQDPARLASFKALRLNLGTSDVVYQQLLEAGVWARIESDDVEQSNEYVLGVDLAGGAAMSAFARYDMRTGRLDARAAFPSEPSLTARGRADGVDTLYVRMAERGELIQCGTHAVDLAEMLGVVREQWGTPACIIADRWKERDLKEGLHRARFPRCPLIVRGQGFKDGGADVAAFRKACLEDYVKPVPSLLLRAAMREARTVADPARNEKLAKSSEGGRRQKARDDAAAAAILAVAEGFREKMRRAA